MDCSHQRFGHDRKERISIVNQFLYRISQMGGRKLHKLHYADDVS